MKKKKPFKKPGRISKKSKRRFGLMKGKIKIVKDFDTPVEFFCS